MLHITMFSGLYKFMYASMFSESFYYWNNTKMVRKRRKKKIKLFLDTQKLFDNTFRQNNLWFAGAIHFTSSFGLYNFLRNCLRSIWFRCFKTNFNKNQCKVCCHFYFLYHFSSGEHCSDIHFSYFEFRNRYFDFD